MKKISFIFYILLFQIASCFSQQEIVYKKTSNTINDSVETLIKLELYSPNYETFDGVTYCGPNLWSRYRKIEGASRIIEGDIQFKIPITKGGEEIKNGKLIQRIDDFKIIWNQIIMDLKNSQVFIRKLNKKEKTYYWSIIFFDIEEPVFLIENEKFKLILDFDIHGNLKFIEEYIEN